MDEDGDLLPDFCFEQKRLVVEAIGYEAHGGDRAKFEKDAVRVSRLVAAGFAVFPVTSRMLDKDEARVMDRIRQALENRSIRRRNTVRSEDVQPVGDLF